MGHVSVRLLGVRATVREWTGRCLARQQHRLQARRARERRHAPNRRLLEGVHERAPQGIAPRFLVVVRLGRADSAATVARTLSSKPVPSWTLLRSDAGGGGVVVGPRTMGAHHA